MDTSYLLRHCRGREARQRPLSLAATHAPARSDLAPYGPLRGSRRVAFDEAGAA